MSEKEEINNLKRENYHQNTSSNMNEKRVEKWSGCMHANISTHRLTLFAERSGRWKSLIPPFSSFHKRLLRMNDDDEDDETLMHAYIFSFHLTPRKKFASYLFLFFCLLLVVLSIKYEELAKKISSVMRIF